MALSEMERTAQFWPQWRAGFKARRIIGTRHVPHHASDQPQWRAGFKARRITSTLTANSYIVAAAMEGGL